MLEDQLDTFEVKDSLTTSASGIRQLELQPNQETSLIIENEGPAQELSTTAAYHPFNTGHLHRLFTSETGELISILFNNPREVTTSHGWEFCSSCFFPHLQTFECFDSMSFEVPWVRQEHGSW